MFRDTRDTLRRLEEALLAEEQAASGTADSKEICPGRGRLRNTDRTDVDPEAYSRVLLKKRKGIGCLILLAVLLMLGMVLAAAGWLVYNRGIL